MVEQWTKERRLERTRELLVDAAEDVFARRGFTAATLDDIAAAAGYTRGAFYVHFKTKEDVFFAVSDRYWRRLFDKFAEALGNQQHHVGEHELADIAARWVDLVKDDEARHAILGYEFTLYLLRHPDARARVAEKRRRVAEDITAFVMAGLHRRNVELRIPVTDFVQLMIATSDGVVLAAELGDADLYRSAVAMYNAVICTDPGRTASSTPRPRPT